MLKYVKNINVESVYGLWEINESFDQLAKDFDYGELEVISTHHPKKKLEHLATRHLLKSLADHFKIGFSGVFKDEYGKPHLKNSSFHISVSHAYPYVVCLINKKRPCGIDIEKPRDQINRIKHKFLSEEEIKITQEDPKKLCLFWSSKEALYKLYGRKNLLFIENINVEFGLRNVIKGKIILENQISKHDLIFNEYKDHVIVYSI